MGKSVKSFSQSAVKAALLRAEDCEMWLKAPERESMHPGCCYFHQFIRRFHISEQNVKNSFSISQTVQRFTSPALLSHTHAKTNSTTLSYNESLFQRPPSFVPIHKSTATIITALCSDTKALLQWEMHNSRFWVKF